MGDGIGKIYIGNSQIAPLLLNKVGGDVPTGFLVQVIDYDGTVLKSERLNEGDTFTLPNQPYQTGLTFQSWSSPVTITNNTITVPNSDVTIGATYITTSGLSEFDVTLTTVTGLTVTLNMNGTKNWGDGTSDTSTSHTYTSVGDYTITCNGSTRATSSGIGLFGQGSSSSSVYNYYVKNVRLGSSVTSIGDYAFDACKSLTSITIPSSVTSIGNYAFQYCSSLTSITIPSSVTSIRGFIVYSCSSLTSITIPSSVTSISSDAFCGCYSLASITIPNSVISISNNVFDLCKSLTSITIPSSVTILFNQAFQNCYSLTSITLSSSITSISDYTFYGCYSLTSITIPEGVTSINNYAFRNCYSLTSITIPSSVISIGTDVFQNCYSLTSITIPEGVTSIGTNVFLNCTSLTSITIPSSVTSIGSSAFQNCTSLTSITIPEGVTSIGSGAFYGCSSILEYDFSNHTAIPTLSNTNAFNGINTGCKIYVPWDLYNGWKATTNWSTYANYIDGGTPATLNFTVTPANSIIYVNGSQIQGTSTSWIGPTTPYVVHDSTNNAVLTGTQTGITEGTVINITADLTTSGKITLSTGITGLTAKFTIGGLTFDATDEGSGNYSINVVGSGDTISYSVKGEGYAKSTGAITTTGSNITQNVTMEPSTEEPWTRPNLTANGTLGGDDFAVCCTNPEFNDYTWRAVDDFEQDMGSEWYGHIEESPDYVFYNPNPLNVTELKFVFGYRMSDDVEIYGSEDGSNWVEIESSYNSEPSYDEEIGMRYTTCTLTNDNFYNYYKIVFEGWDVVTISDLQITATQLA